MTTISRPGAYYYLGGHAGEDVVRTFTLYSSYDETSGAGTPVDLTGCSFKAEGMNSSGTSQWEVTPTAATPTNGQITLTIPLATTTAKKGLEGEWALRVTWANGTKTFPVWGRWGFTSIVLVD